MAPGCAASGDGDPYGRPQWCRNGSAAAHLKLVSIGVILAASVAGISAPVALSRLFEGRPAYARALLLIKCFAAGVILSTALVHVLPDAAAALGDCQVSSRRPWRDFPFGGLVTLLGALLALLVDLSASSHAAESHAHYSPVGLHEMGCHKKPSLEAGTVAHGLHLEEGGEREKRGEEEEERAAKAKQRMVSKVLEIGIVFHSVIIGAAMGMSQNQCAIRSLIVALAFHQIFEGMGLGGCIAQAGFGLGTVAYMCMVFSVTTPMGVVLGMTIFYMTGYDDSSPNALILEGLLGSLSAGILVYMALVDLIALDFFHSKTMSSAPGLKKLSFLALVAGSASMSVLALWA